MSLLAEQAVDLAPVEQTGIERFAGMLAHELRNPLASATTNLAVAADLTSESDPRTAFLKRAEAEMERIRILLESCLELAKTGRVQRRIIGIDAMCQAIQTRFASTHPSLQFEVVAEEGLEFSVDPNLVVRAIENLCENAAREAAPGSIKVRLTAKVEEQDLFFLIEDNGPGIPLESREEVFEPFVTGREGSGLGLAFDRQVAVAHDGKVAVGDSELGGALFSIEIPKAPEADYSWLTSSL